MVPRCYQMIYNNCFYPNRFGVTSEPPHWPYVRRHQEKEPHVWSWGGRPYIYIYIYIGVRGSPERRIFFPGARGRGGPSPGISVPFFFFRHFFSPFFFRRFFSPFSGFYWRLLLKVSTKGVHWRLLEKKKCSLKTSKFIKILQFCRISTNL